MLGPNELLAAGRAIIIEREPYLTTALLALIPSPRPGMCVGRGWGVSAAAPYGVVAPFAVTNSMIMYYDPDVLQHWLDTNANLSEVAEWTAFCLAHEMGHPMRDHLERARAGAYHPRKYNRAADFEINDDLKEAGYKPPPLGALFPDEMLKKPDGSPVETGLTAEQYYHIDPWQPGDDEGGMCGGGSGAGDPWDDEDEEAQDGRSESDRKNIQRQTAEAIKNHAKQARGDTPGGWLRWAESKLKPPEIAWQDELQYVAMTALEYTSGMVERTYRKPSRRQAVWGYGHDSPIMPGWHAPRPVIVVVIDTSGSMGDEELLRAASETKGIVENMGADVILMTNDADLCGPIQRIQSLADVKLHGGGGTDFRPPFDFIKFEPSLNPGLCVFITDGIGPAHKTNPVPSMHTIWVGVGPYRQRPWGASENDSGWTPGEAITWGSYIEVKEVEKVGSDYYGQDDPEDEQDDGA